MRRKTKQIGLMIGVMMMTAMTGTGTVFAAAGPAKTEKTVTAPKSAGSEKKTDRKDQDSGYYGKVKKVETDKVILEEAEVVREKESGKAKDNTEADFENGSVKWKLSGRTIEIKLDSDTKLYKEMIAPKNDKKPQEKKQDPTKKEDTKSKGIPLKKIRDGSLVKVSLREDGSGIASEIMMLSGVKEVKAEKQEA